MHIVNKLLYTSIKNNMNIGQINIMDVCRLRASSHSRAT